MRKTNYSLGGGRKAKAHGAPETSDADSTIDNSSAVVFAEISAVLVLALGSALIVSVIIAAVHFG